MQLKSLDSEGSNGQYFQLLGCSYKEILVTLLGRQPKSLYVLHDMIVEWLSQAEGM